MLSSRFRLVGAAGVACTLVASVACDDAFVASSGGGAGGEATAVASGGATTTATSTGTAGGGGLGAGGSGSGGSGGAGAGGGGPLNDTGLLVRYFLDEQQSGAPTGAIIDSAPTPIHLQLGGMGNLSYVIEDGSRGLNWSWKAGETTDPARVFVFPGPSKIAQRVQEQATIEVVARIEATTAAGSRLINWGNTGLDADFTIAVTAAGFSFRSNQDDVEVEWAAAPENTWRVYHFVIDRMLTTVPTAHRMYVDGLAHDGLLTVGSQSEALAPLNINPAGEFTVGNRSDNQRSIHGTIGYVAVYDRAMLPADVVDHVQILLLGHDANSAGQ